MVLSSGKKQNARYRTLIIISLVLILIGVGIKGGLHSSIGTTAQNAVQKIKAAEYQPSTPSDRAIDFVSLVKKLKPVVVREWQL